MSLHTREGVLFSNDEAQEEGRAWDLKEEFKYAPKRPEGDPWKTLLDPLLEREKKRCDSWNTEIQNLLIFAGLFSGLVTAFIIESYKNLQPDPNAGIVAFLAHISLRLDNSSNASVPVTPPSLRFIPTHAAVRVNVFWFISLILSLTVILSGIIAMQWLREHQAYTGQSSKDMIAILNMRVESLERWHVKDIITTFPPVLAVALVLFFAGIIDFLHVLGNDTLLISVATVITISLILLVTSTTLPSAQCTFLYLWLGHQDPPSPCPYKSPQSGFFHGVCYYISTFFSRHRSWYFTAIGDWLRGLTELNTRNKHALLYLTDTWSKKSWAEVDLCWLSIREACLFPYELEGYHEFLDRNGIPPLFDITKTFKGVIDGVTLPNDILYAVYHCFYEVSTPFVSRDHPKRKAATQRNELDPTFEMIQWRNNFLHSLIHSQEDQNLLDVEFLPVKDSRKTFHTNISVLHHHNLFAFTDRLMGQYPKEFSDHRIEIAIRLGSDLYNRWYETAHRREQRLPSYLRGEIFDQRRWKTLKNDITVPVFEQYVYFLIKFFDGTAHRTHVIDISSNQLLVHNDIAELLENAAWDTYRVVTAHNLSKHSPTDRRKALRVFRCLLEKISDLLRLSITQPNSEPLPANPIHLLYLCAIYIRRLNSLRFHAGPLMDQQAIGLLEEAIVNMRKCKTVLVERRADMESETRNWLSRKDRFGSVTRFSAEWWRFLDGKHDEYSKDSDESAANQRRRPAHPPPVLLNPVSNQTVAMAPIGSLGIPSAPKIYSAPDHLAPSSSWHSTYTYESYPSTNTESPITSGHNSLVSSPIIDDKRPSFNTSPVIPYSISSLRRDRRQEAFSYEGPRVITSQSSSQQMPSKESPPHESTSTNDVEMGDVEHASRGFPVPQPSAPVHVPSDTPYDTSDQRRTMTRG